MCGIFAYVGREKVDTEKCLDQLRHRGPDGEGVFKSGEVVFGHRRLAIIDLDTRSNQPLVSSSGNTRIVFNGEIYNYRKLRADLRAKGVAFTTESDTEVILAGYELEGVDFFTRLRGMWAFVIHDTRNNTIVAARDSFGIKPLIYARNGESLYFASEIRCLKDVVPLTPDPDAYAVFYNVGYFIAPATPYKGVRKLCPGEILSFDIATKEMSVIGHTSRFLGESREAVSYTQAVDMVDQALTSSVEAHYVSDVPVSILLSGGNDSSLIAALSHKLGKNPTAYHISVPGSDDTPYAQAVAKKLSIPLVVEQLTNEALAAQYEKVWSVLDEPTGDISIIPTSLVYERIKGNAKVVLSGEGGDELFGGYHRHRMLARHTKVSKEHLTSSLLNGLLGTNALALSTTNPMVGRARDALLGHGGINDLIGAYLKSTRLIDYPLYEKKIRDSLYELYAREHETGIAAMLAFDMLAYLPNSLLPKSDIASMASSIEARVPFLDRCLASDVLRMNGNFSENLQDKKLLKEVLVRYLPADLVYRSKTGFSASLKEHGSFVSDFHAACEFHLQDRTAFGIDEAMASLIKDRGTRTVIARKYPRFAFALISSWKCFVI